MTFKVLIVDDNHSFIDSLKVMLRDMQIDFVHAFRFGDALAHLESHGTFYVREPAEDNIERTPKKLYNEGGIFLVIVEQNTESSMKGTDFIAHAVKKYPGLTEADFILLTHRLEQVPTKTPVFPVIEKPLRTPQVRQIAAQKLKAAQDTVEMQIRLSVQREEDTETVEKSPKTAKRKGLRDFLKLGRGEAQAEDYTPPKKVAKKAAAKPKKKAAVKRKKSPK